MVSGRTPAGIAYPISAIDEFDPAGAMEALANSVALAMHPVGSLYFSDRPTNPSQFFGGTWVAWGAGRAVVGFQAGNADFSPVERTGGTANVTLTAAQSGLRAHNHTQAAHHHSVGAHNHPMPHTHVVPAHAHSMAHHHSVGAHNHPMPHTHVVPAHAHSMAHHHSVGAHNHPMPHTHFTGFNAVHVCGSWGTTQPLTINSGVASLTTGFHTGQPNNLDTGNSTAFNSGQAVTGTNNAARNSTDTWTGNTGQPSSANTGNSTAFNTGASSSANTGNSTAFNTGASSSANTGNSTAFNTGNTTPTINNVAAENATAAHTNLQPYITIHIFKRTA